MTAKRQRQPRGLPREGTKALELGEVAGDLGAGPVLCADELSAEDALFVDDVGFGDLGGAVECVDALVGIADGDKVDVMLGEETLVDVGVLVHADGDYFEVRHLFLKGEEAGELFDARGTGGCPQVEHDDMAAEFAEIDGAGAVADDELRGGLVDVRGMTSAVASRCHYDSQYQTCPDSTHGTLHFL
jgi:hypothetical protein